MANSTQNTTDLFPDPNVRRTKQVVKFLPGKSTVKRFLKSDLENYNDLVPTEDSETAFPNLYKSYTEGEESLPPDIKFVKNILLDADNLIGSDGTVNTYYDIQDDKETAVDNGNPNRSSVRNNQSYRHGGTQLKQRFQNLRLSIENNGFKKIHPAISVLLVKEKGEETYYIITGMGRREILVDLNNFENLIVSVYEPAGGHDTLRFAKNAISQCGVIFNTHHDPASAPSKDDVYSEVSRAIDAKYIDPTYDDIKARVESLCGNVFSKSVRDQLAIEITHELDPDTEVQGWKSPRDYIPWLAKNKLVDTDNIKYVCVSADNASKSVFKVISEGGSNPQKEVRIILHTGRLTGTDVKKTFLDRLANFFLTYNDFVHCIGQVYSERPNFTPEARNIKFWGVLPAIANMTDDCVTLDKLIYFDPYDPEDLSLLTQERPKNFKRDNLKKVS